MTVAELIAKLQKIPSDTKVYLDGGEYKDNYVPATTITKYSGWGLKNVVLIT